MPPAAPPMMVLLSSTEDSSLTDDSSIFSSSPPPYVERKQCSFDDNENQKACDETACSATSRTTTSSFRSGYSHDEDEETPYCYPRTVSSQSFSSSTSGGRKQVSFAVAYKLVYETIHISEYTPDERCASWYNIRDLKSFKRDRRDTARRIDQGRMYDDDCVRGVENATHSGSRLRHHHIVDGINSVLNEQDLQDQDGKWNPDSLAFIYRVASEESVHLARKRGLQDQTEIWEDLEQQQLHLRQCNNFEHAISTSTTTTSADTVHDNSMQTIEF
mmetsp:Transcript_31026/g.51669  ORF Transcript_31026/g.51669 Transcript_31026/m.51669 type:complete len:274 (-) Transcript_31026:447-1268(-)|eukprot:CAMPEP_0178733644 /NCGR_PEP_ID=MMETSP0744-20121128/904_1 /TAXON_ID=913974 /ORGANISM="Nitzschia punctata, Strain CCMP561" /LENGTH=273 /DNA_ID=CAMNT_0020385839 /DNA_START=203 /DNA_END=1024 /DNA_ORIENTATION=+